MSIADKLITIAENEQKVYDAGKQAEHDAFWDAYQQDGERGDYQYAFYGKYWNNTTFNPKHPIKVTWAQSMFMYSDIYGEIELDTSACSSFTNMFHSANFSKIGVMDMRKATGLTNTFHNMPDLVEIEKLIITENLNFGGTNTFGATSKLERLTIEGTIGQDGLNLKFQTKLTQASILSIMNALSSTTSGLTVTLSKAAVDEAFKDEEYGIIGSEHPNWIWETMKKSNWIVSLV